MSLGESVKYVVEDSVAWITLNRPDKRNALNTQMRKELLEALRLAEHDGHVRVVVLEGAGGNFCAGADLNELYSLTGLGIRQYHREVGTQLIAQYMQDMTKVVIAAVDGYCLGGGCEIIQGCDLVIATSRAVFGQTEVRVGLVPGGGATQRLPRYIGLRKAKELMFTGRMINAQEAERLGLVNMVVEPDKLREEVLKLAEEIKTKSPVIVALIKRAINTSQETHLSAGLEFEKEIHYFTWLTEDRAEGIKAFLEKRKPEFKGK